MQPIKIATVRASDYIRANLDESRDKLAALGTIVIPINDVYYPHLNRTERFQIYYGGSGSGKSHFVATLLLLRALKKQHFRCLYTRKFERTVRVSQFALFKDLIGQYRLEDYFEVNETDMRIRCRSTGNTLLPAGLDDVHKVRSVPGLNCVWIEEVIDRKGSVTRFDFLELNRRLRDKGVNTIYMTFNPIVKQSWVHSIFFEQQKDSTFILKTTHKDNLFLPNDFREQMEELRSLSPDEYAVFTLGEWGSLDSDNLYLFDEAAVYSLHTNSDFIEGGEHFITADVAFTGDDSTVIMAWRGWKVIDVKVMQKSTTQEVLSAIRQIAATYRVPQSRVCFDATGVGVALRSLMPAALAFDGSSSPIDDAPSRPAALKAISPKPAFKNLRAQVYSQCARVVNDGKAAYAPTFGLDKLQQELMQIRWLNSVDVIRHQLESKDLIRSRLGRSPDFADAFALRAMFDLFDTAKPARSNRKFVLLQSPYN
ncbi:MAG: PBSX family phage terminase large subunit [Candidatus Norongarragalinales archaeon]